MTIQVYGDGERERAAARILRAALAGRSGVLRLFPIPTKSPEGQVPAARGDFAVGYAFPSALARDLAERGVPVIDLAQDEVFLKENARLTALGALGHILCTQGAAPSGLTVGIVGFGRIGSELLRLFLFLGATCRVYTASEEKRRELGSFGIGCERSDGEETGERFRGLDLLINTAPAKLIRPEEAPALGAVRVLELASGDNIPKAVAFERLASIPGRMFARDAARLYAAAAMRALNAALPEEPKGGEPRG